MPKLFRSNSSNQILLAIHMLSFKFISFIHTMFSEQLKLTKFIEHFKKQFAGSRENVYITFAISGGFVCAKSR